MEPWSAASRGNPAASATPTRGSCRDPTTCDAGDALDEDTGRLTTIVAWRNSISGGAGNAVRCRDIRMGRPETLGLTFLGPHFL